MKGIFPLEKLERIQTPFYYYDAELLRQTLRTITQEVSSALCRQGQCEPQGAEDYP